MYGENVTCLNLHHEQFYNDNTKEHMLPKDTYSRDVYHLCWSNKFKLDLCDSGVDPSLIRVIGNPRFDSYVLPSLASIESATYQYERVIFVPTTFSWAFVDEDYFLKTDSIDPIEFKKTREITLNAAKAYFAFFHDMAMKYPQYVFILRPHPFEDIENFREKFLEFSSSKVVPCNVLINRDNNVYNWMKVSDVVVGWCTTVNIEAVIAGVQSVVYHPTDYPSRMNLEFFQYFDIIYDDRRMERIISGEDSTNLKQGLDHFISNSMGYSRSQVTPELAKWIYDIFCCQEKEIFKLNKLFFLKFLFKSLSVDLVKNILTKMGILGLVNKRYAGLLEDYKSENDLNRDYNKFKELYSNER
jgi:hypothetical protein